jgi:hypothetical protein
MVKNRDFILKEFPLPNCLHDLNREELITYVSIKKSPVAVITLQEVFHLYDSLYDTIRTARYDYYLYCKRNYPADFICEDEEDRWIQLHYLVNSLMWYNASFDIILQCIWIFYGLYYNKQEKNSIRTKNIKEIQEQCSFDKINEHERSYLIDENLLKKLRKFRAKRDKIAEFVNKFKHNCLLTKGGEMETFWVEVKLKNSNSSDKPIYESSDTQKEMDTKQAEQALKNYHKSMLSFVELMNGIFLYKARK